MMSSPGASLLHPVPLLAMAVLVLNDHWWKRAWPSFWTGKISDVAGLLFFPVLLATIWEIGAASFGRTWRPQRVIIVAALATAIVFTLTKTWLPANAVARATDGWIRWAPRALAAWVEGARIPERGHPSMVMDPTDLFALPAVLWGVFRGHVARGSSEAFRVGSPA